VSGYQEGGPDYIHALLTGYHDEVPAGMTTEEGEPFVLAEGMNFNTAFPGHQIAMAKPLSDGQVEYTDGTPATVDQYAKDVAAFLMWTAEPKLEERKKLGVRVMIFLLITALLLYLSKRILWSRIGH
jgi:ubiquinol-cytochrome c reductase cytochrome b/c1 subunit